MPDWTMIPLQWLECQIAQWIASGLWALNQIWLLYAVMFYYLRYWLEHNLFDNLLTALFGPANVETAWIGPSLGLAVLIGGVFILLRQAGVRHSPVDLRKAAMWVIGLGFLFANHSWVFSELESFRNSIAGSAYETAGGISQAIMSGSYSSPGNELPNQHTGAINIPHLFAQTTSPYTNAGDVSALDLAAYSLSATQNDIVQMPLDHPPLPAAFNQTYFNNGDFFPLFPPADNGARTHAVNKALLGSVLMFINVVPCIVAMVAAGIAFGLSLTAIVLFCSLPLTLPFVFFEATEVMALSIIKAYLNLIVKTWIINLILSIFLGFNAYWAMSGNAAIFVTMSGITLYFCWQFQHLTRQTFYQALNTITSGIGAATGVKMIDPVRSLQQVAGRAVQAGVSAAAVIGTGGAAAPAVAGALLSSAGAVGGGTALMYSAAHRQKDPGEFARRGLIARQQEAMAVLSPEEQRLATRAAAIQNGQEPGDRTWAANTLTQMGQRVRSRQAGNTALRASLMQAGILPADDQAQKNTEREQSAHNEQALGMDLRHAPLAPAQMQEAVDAAAVLEGLIPGNPAQAQATLTQLGSQAQQSRAARSTLRAQLTRAQVLTTNQDRERMQGLQNALGMHPDQTHLTPDQLDEAIEIAETTLPTPGAAASQDTSDDPLAPMGAQATAGRAHREAVRSRLIEAGILPPPKGSQTGEGGAGAPTPAGQRTGTGSHKGSGAVATSKASPSSASRPVATSAKPTGTGTTSPVTTTPASPNGPTPRPPASEPDEDLGWGEPPPVRQSVPPPSAIIEPDENLGWGEPPPVRSSTLPPPAISDKITSAPIQQAPGNTPVAAPLPAGGNLDDSDLLIPPPPPLTGAIASPAGAENTESMPEIAPETHAQAGGSLTPGDEAEPATATKGKGRNPYYWAHRRNQEKQGLPVNRRPRKK